MRGFTKIRGNMLGVAIVRTIIYWGPLILGNYYVEVQELDLRIASNVSKLRASAQGPILGISQVTLPKGLGLKGLGDTN